METWRCDSLAPMAGCGGEIVMEEGKPDGKTILGDPTADGRSLTTIAFATAKANKARHVSLLILTSLLTHCSFARKEPGPRHTRQLV